MRAYVHPVSVHKLFAVLIAVAVLLAPAFTRAGEAFAAVPDHHAQMMDASHCQAPPSESGDHGMAPADSCCISMCMGIAVTAAAPASDSQLPPQPAAFAVPTLLLSYLGEIATPPPRHS